MGRHLDFIGQRADKAIVVDVGPYRAVPEEEGHFVKYGIVKRVERYTMTCDECGGVGYYDDLGEVICDGCGMVLSGDRQPTLGVEEETNTDSPGSSRGMIKHLRHVPGTHEPSQEYVNHYSN